MRPKHSTAAVDSTDQASLLTWQMALLHVGLAFVAIYFRVALAPLMAGFVVFSLLKVIRTRNATGTAHIAAAFVVGAEVFLRMGKAALFWEFGKYSAILLLVVAMFTENRLGRRYPLAYVLLVLLLFPSWILLVNEYPDFERWRESLGSYLSGMVLLGVATMYFFERTINVEQFKEMLAAVLLPIISMLSYIFIVSPNLSIGYELLAANVSQSGGYGPNQVSTVLGFGVLVIVLSLMLKVEFVKPRSMAILLLILLSYRALLTFSRGGVLVPVAALIAASLYVSIKHQGAINVTRFSRQFLVVALLAALVWEYVDSQTQGFLTRRYEGETFSTQYTGEMKMYSGREEVLLNDLNQFWDHPLLGVGPGRAAHMRKTVSVRENYVSSSIAPHTEYSRLLAEHGLLGAAIICILLFFPLFYMRKVPATDLLMYLAFMLFTMLTMAHSATRIGLPAFVYGVAYIRIVRLEPEK